MGTRKSSVTAKPAAEPKPAKTTATRKEAEPTDHLPHRFVGTDRTTHCESCGQFAEAHIHLAR